MTERPRQAYVTNVANLCEFVKRLPQSNVKFVFFYADKMDVPRVVATGGKHKDWYIVPGQHSNYFYAYKKSNLVYMVSDMRLKQRGTVMLYTSKLNRTRPQTRPKDTAYLGNHIDFSIQDTREGRVYFRTHWTEYFECNDDLNFFQRRADDVCNFLTADKSFGKTTCVTRDNKPMYQLDFIFSNKTHQEIIEDLYNASQGTLKKRGQAGGAFRIDPFKNYKGISTSSPDFHRFMNRSIFVDLWSSIRVTPLYVYMYFDEGNELDEKGQKAIQYVVEFNEDATVAFSVSSHQALKACWTELNINIASLTEKRMLSKWKRSCSDFITSNFAVMK